MSNETDIWKLRAEAALPIIKAAINLTYFDIELTRGNNRTVVPTPQYDALKDAVSQYIAAAINGSGGDK